MKLALFLLLTGLTWAETPKKIEPPKCESGSMLGVNKDGKVCWAGEYDAVAKEVLKNFAAMNANAQKLEVQNDLLSKEVLRLRQSCHE